MKLFRTMGQEYKWVFISNQQVKQYSRSAVLDSRWLWHCAYYNRGLRSLYKRKFSQFYAPLNPKLIRLPCAIVISLEILTF